jgi:hypothetical protein
MALEILRHFEQALGAQMAGGQTYPGVDERIGRFDSVAILELGLFRTLKGFRSASERVMGIVSALLGEMLVAMPDDAKLALIEVRRQVSDDCL